MKERNKWRQNKKNCKRQCEIVEVENKNDDDDHELVN